MDTQNEGSGVRSAIQFGICAAFFVLGWFALQRDTGILGFILWAAGPLICVVIEQGAKQQAAERVLAELEKPAEVPAGTVDEVGPEETELADISNERIANLRHLFVSRELIKVESSISNGESLVEWCERTADIVAETSGIDRVTVYSMLVHCAMYRKPRSGESVAAWFDEMIERIEDLKSSEGLDLSGPGSSKQIGETNSEWLARVIPLCLQVKHGESFDDLIEPLASIAEKAPVEPGESITAWLERVQSQIIEYNDQNQTTSLV